MIGKLTGLIAGLGEAEALVDVNQVGYLVQCGNKTLSRLKTGEQASLAISTQMSESSIKLYGFLDDLERAWFERLQVTPGIGAKAALAILDVMTPADIMDAAALEDDASFARAKGVGKKIAQRVAGDLKGKAPPMALWGGFAPVYEPGTIADTITSSRPQSAVTSQGQSTNTDQSNVEKRRDIISALENLGYNPADAARAAASVCQNHGEDEDMSSLIRFALKELMPA